MKNLLLKICDWALNKAEKWFGKDSEEYKEVETEYLITTEEIKSTK